MFDLEPRLRAVMSGDPDFRAVLWEVRGLERSGVDPARWLSPEEAIAVIGADGCRYRY